MARYLMPFRLAELEQVRTDVLVVGTGIAGLYTALKAKPHGAVLVLTKRSLEDSNTGVAQGGIAAAIGREDSPQLHFEDTLEAGAGLCDPAAVQVLVDEGPECVMELVEMGTRFDREGGGFALTREGAHSERRILHAHGDATGEEIRRALAERTAAEGIAVLEGQFLVDVLTDADGRCLGALARDRRGVLRAFLAGATVLATGGAGQLYRNSTNPEVTTGDGIAAAFRAGAQVADLEFVQFHPTALCRPGTPKFLISEAVRGEGAVLLNARGERFMPDRHPRAELAPRDVVARAILDEMSREGTSCVYLDTRVLGEAGAARFPHIYAYCRSVGIDPVREPIPVAPAAHYLMGGVRTDIDGRTNLPGLYACGEAAATGIHGANRLASNSLLEGLVFGRRIARYLSGRRPVATTASSLAYVLPVRGAEANGTEEELQELMWREVGLIRDGEGLRRALVRLREIAEGLEGPLADPADLVLANLSTMASLVAAAAWERTESRGGHFRADYPSRDDERWLRHLVQRHTPGNFV